MSTDVTLWQRPEIVDELDTIIQQNDDLDLILAQIPSLFGTSEKATYLGFRAVGMNVKQALELLGYDNTQLEVWKEETPELVEFEYKYLGELQSKVSADIIRLGFLRNMTMFLLRDQLVIRKSVIDMEGMTPREFQYLRAVRRFYSTSDLLALGKAIEPEKHRNNTLVLSFGENHYQIVDGDPDSMELFDE